MKCLRLLCLLAAGMLLVGCGGAPSGQAGDANDPEKTDASSFNAEEEAAANAPQN